MTDSRVMVDKRLSVPAADVLGKRFQWHLLPLHKCSVMSFGGGTATIVRVGDEGTRRQRHLAICRKQCKSPWPELLAPSRMGQRRVKRK